MLKLDSSRFAEGVYILSEESKDFDEELYLSVRKKEGRLYSDDIVKKLPFVRINSALDKEWKVRAASYNKLVKYFRAGENLTLLEVGCGNGWLSNGLAVNTPNRVIGLDLNHTELLQAARVFSKRGNLDFVYGNLFEDLFPLKTFDAILFASSIQYFVNFSHVINRCFKLLKDNGEIHIVDSNFYKEDELAAARNRTFNYFRNTGFPDMSRYYNHHCWKELNNYNYSIKNKPSVTGSGFGNIFNKNRIPFPWIIIMK